MARKADPNDVIDDFQRQLRLSLINWGRTVTRLGPKRNGLRKEASIDAFLRAAVGFETFRSDWHIAAINRDASVFSKAVQLTVRTMVAGTRGDYRGAADFVTLVVPKHPNVNLIRAIVDPLGKNITFQDGSWERRADRELASPYREKVRGLTDKQKHLIDAVAAIRNAIAHRSMGSVAEMNSKLLLLPAGLHRGINRIQISGLGSYLWASAPGRSAARVELFFRSLRNIAESLRT